MDVEIYTKLKIPSEPCYIFEYSNGSCEIELANHYVVSIDKDVFKELLNAVLEDRLGQQEREGKPWRDVTEVSNSIKENSNGQDT